MDEIPERLKLGLGSLTPGRNSQINVAAIAWLATATTTLRDPAIAAAKLPLGTRNRNIWETDWLQVDAGSTFIDVNLRQTEMGIGSTEILKEAPKILSLG